MLMNYLKKIFTLSLGVLFIQLIGFSFADQYVKPTSSRVKTILNAEWKYYKGNASGAQNTNFNDGSWSNVNIPHSFSIPYKRESRWYEGIGWYRKHFRVDSKYSGKKVFIEFEAAFQHSWVYVNGDLVGEYKGGYTSFTFDITDKVQFGQDNLIAVKLSCEWDYDITPRGGEHQFSGGIYRDVYLTITDPVHVGYYGTFVTTPFDCPSVNRSGGYTGQSSYSKAPVKVKTTVKNSSSESKSYKLKSYLVDSSNNIVDSSMVTTKTINTNSEYTFEQNTTLNSFNLWSPSSPYLYKVYTELYDDSKLLDTYESTFGIRWIQWTGKQGFFLNGKHLFLLGFNVHQDHEGWCDAITQAASYRDVKMCKDAGCNFIRGSHYPHSQTFANACDKLGLLLWSELPMWGIGSFNGNATYWNSSAYPPRNEDKFEKNTTQMLKDMMQQRRNHPSVIVWSLGNEVDYTTSSAKSKLMSYVKELHNLIKTEDPKRASGLGMGYGPCSFRDLDDLIDVSGYNGGGLRMTDPGHPNMVSEFGSRTGFRPGRYDGHGIPRDVGAWRAGNVLWCAFHHGSHYSMGHMGCVDFDRVPQKGWYWFRNKWAKVPPPTWPSSGTAAKIKLSGDVYSNPCYDKENPNIEILDNGTEDCMLVVKIMNADDKQINKTVNVKLEVTNGKGMFASGNSTTLSTKWGIAAAEFRSYDKGIVKIKATSSGLESDEITITIKEPPVSINNYYQNNNKLKTGQIHLALSGITANKLRYTISGNFSLTKKPTLNIYSLKGRLIRSVKLSKPSGIIELDKSGKIISNSVVLCRLKYGNATAVTKNIILK